MDDPKWEPTHKDLENLFVNNDTIDSIEAHLNRFNPIRVMRMEGMEVRHSNILGWLLDPAESHSLGDKFTKAFLSETLRENNHGHRPSALDIVRSDLRDVEVKREWQHIDLFLLSRRNNWAFIIENKFHASQSAGQLDGYAEKIRSIFEAEGDDLSITGCFLTLHEDPPEDASYFGVRYDTICELLNKTLAAAGSSIGPQVRTFIEHYIEIIEEATGMSKEQTEMMKMARALYAEHRKVLDFIWEHGSTSDFLLAVHDLFEIAGEDDTAVDYQGSDLVILDQWHDGFSFLPKSLHTALGGASFKWDGCEKWGSGLPIYCGISVLDQQEGRSANIRLQLQVGPLRNHAARKHLIEAIQSVAARNSIKEFGFQRTAAELGKKYSSFDKNSIIGIKDINDLDEIKRGVAVLLKRFLPHLALVEKELGNFRRDYGTVGG